MKQSSSKKRFLTTQRSNRDNAHCASTPSTSTRCTTLRREPNAFANGRQCMNWRRREGDDVGVWRKQAIVGRALKLDKRQSKKSDKMKLRTDQPSEGQRGGGSFLQRFYGRGGGGEAYQGIKLCAFVRGGVRAGRTKFAQRVQFSMHRRAAPREGGNLREGRSVFTLHKARDLLAASLRTIRPHPRILIARPDPP